MADLTHPTIVDELGGRAKFMQRLEAIAREMKGQGFRFQGNTFSEPSDLVEASGEVYAVVPFRLDMTAPGEIPGTLHSYLIGVSKDQGSNWKFIDGGGVAGDRAKLRQVLPNFPSNLQLPAKQEPVWQKG